MCSADGLGVRSGSCLLLLVTERIQSKRWQTCEDSTPDLYRVNFEVNNLKPFACLAFPQIAYLKTPRKQPIFGDELLTSFCKPNLSNPHLPPKGFWHMARHAINVGYGLTGLS